MFDLDKWQEIVNTIRQNKLRTFLTGFSVAWGIFMLIILLGAGQGLENGVKYQFNDDATNSFFLYPGSTSKAFKGMQPGRQTQFTNRDITSLINNVKELEDYSARFYIPGSVTISYQNEYGAFDIRCVHPGHEILENTDVVQGRYLNENDIQQKRKVAVIGEVVKDGLFKDEDPLGKLISINGVLFKVIGVFEDTGGENEMRRIYLPVSTAQVIFGGGENINQIMFTVDASAERSEEIEKEIMQLFARSHTFDPEDDNALYIRNNLKNFKQMSALFGGIRIFVLIIGIGTIIAGIVGVSNIMIIVVKERTKEIGLRKALGATPNSIISLVITESIFITGISGYIGLMGGVGLLELLGAVLPPNDFFRNPQANVEVAIAATILLVIAGAVAGLVPAMRAAHINPIEALRDE